MINDTSILVALQPLIDDATTFQEQLSPEREKFNNIYNAAPYGGEREGWASTVSPVAFDTVEWIKPFLNDIFNGDFFNITGGDDKASSQMKDYLRFKLWTQGHIMEEIDDFLHYCLTSHYGIFKVTHQENFHYETRKFQTLDAARMQALNASEAVELKKYDEIETLDPLTGETPQGQEFENVEARVKIMDYVGPVVECLPPTELYMSSGYSKLEYCPLVAHVVMRSLDYVRVKERDGIYKKGSYEKVKGKVEARFLNEETAGESAAIFEQDNLEVPAEVTYGNAMNLANATVEIWECYTKLDIDDDGFLEDALVVICENVVLTDPIENEYRSAPFELGVVIKQPHNIIGRNFCQIMESWQRVSTNLQRGIQDAALIATKRGWITTSARTQSQLRNWMPGDTALVDKGGEAKIIDFGAPNQFMFKAFDVVSGEIDRHSGVSEASQGLDRQAANKTLGALELKLNTSQQRQVLYANRLSRTFERVLRRVLDTFRLYPPEDDMQAVGMDINLDEIDFNGEYQFKLDVGVGESQNMQKSQILDHYLQFLLKAGIKMGIANKTHVVRTLDKKAELLGIDMSNLHYSESEVEQMEPQGAPQPPMGPQPGPVNLNNVNR